MCTLVIHVGVSKILFVLRGYSTFDFYQIELNNKT